MKNKLVAVVGMCGAGKSEITNMFIEKGYTCIHFGDLTMDELKRRGLPVNEANEKKIREGIRAEYGKAAYAKLAVDKIDSLSGKDIVLDGLYSWSEYTLLRERYKDMVVLAVITNGYIRKERLKNRPIRPLTAEEVDGRDISEIENLEKGGPIAKADYYILNNADKKALVNSFNEFMSWLNK